MTHAELATLVALTRQLAAVTHSDRVRTACLVIVKAAKARTSRLARVERSPLASPYYGPIAPVVRVVTASPWPAHFSGPLAQTTTGPHLGGGHFPEGTP